LKNGNGAKRTSTDYGEQKIRQFHIGLFRGARDKR